MTRQAIQQWVTAAARDPLAAGDYMDMADYEREYARKFCRAYHASPLLDQVGRDKLAALSISMADMERAIEDDAALYAESDRITANGGRPR